ncbi:MAG: DUF2281 domain-containing protein [Chlorobi bacterium]|nr:DUF2281 domain-containing protein [Chlorobiota bacterium]
METTDIKIHIPLNFKQIVEIIRQLPYDEKLKLSEILRKETGQKKENDRVLTHFASEKALSEDWLLPEEDEAWKNL